MKKAILIFSAFVILLFVLIKGGELWLELNFEKTINEDENRAYDITYSDLDFHTLFKGVTLEKVAIVPLRIDSSTYVKGEVEYATIKGLVWLELMFNGRLNIEEVSFEKPVFEVNIGTKKNKKNSGQGIQSLFGDILSRGDLSSFNIYHGKVIIKEPDGNIKGRIRNIDIKASEIETDSIKLQHIIPFRMGNLNVTIDSAMFQINEFTQINLGDIHYELQDEVLRMHNFSVGFTEDWVKVSKRIGVQKDLISAYVQELKLVELATSSEFYSNLDLVAKKLEVIGLDLKVRKNKNYERPPDVYKPMFKGMVDLIPLQLDVDSILITDSRISYEELGKDKKHSAEISFQKVEGSITGLTTFEEEQKQRQEFVANLNAELYNSGKMKIKLTVPYEEDRFELISDMGSMPMEDFNALAIPMAAVQIDSGQLKQLHFKMNANKHSAYSHLTMDYTGLHLTLIKETEDHKIRKQGFLTSVANSAIRPNNLPSGKKYLTASYTTERNVYRAPFQYIVMGVVDGATRIIPGKTVQSFIHKDKKKKKNKN